MDVVFIARPTLEQARGDIDSYLYFAGSEAVGDEESYLTLSGYTGYDMAFYHSQRLMQRTQAKHNYLWARANGYRSFSQLKRSLRHKGMSLVDFEFAEGTKFPEPAFEDCTEVYVRFDSPANQKLNQKGHQGQEVGNSYVTYQLKGHLNEAEIRQLIS